MMADMVTVTGEWDWDRLRDLLPSTVLEYMAATPPPLACLGDDVPGWRWDEKRQFQVSLAYEDLMDVGERRRASIWNVCSLCHGGPEDIDHVLRFCKQACELWRCVLGQEVANSFDELPFDEWLHGNITGRLVIDIEREEWGM
ncbi:hypothetical protein V6N11_063656 [Hibiscus sabdariffa]|uniref:Reverse transcriptase zinc-binding domain-containing protein n=1 Tax=Hibiscus sabdariffa TaxID=183260 RepID=A0ABR2PLB2_9ROSI